MLKILAYHHYCQYPTLQNHHHYFPLPLPSFLLFSFFIYPNWIRKKKENWYLWRTSCMLDNFIYVISFDLFHIETYILNIFLSPSPFLYMYIYRVPWTQEHTNTQAISGQAMLWIPVCLAPKPGWQRGKWTIVSYSWAGFPVFWILSSSFLAYIPIWWSTFFCRVLKRYIRSKQLKTSHVWKYPYFILTLEYLAESTFLFICVFRIFSFIILKPVFGNQVPK